MLTALVKLSDIGIIHSELKLENLMYDGHQLSQEKVNDNFFLAAPSLGRTSNSGLWGATSSRAITGMQ
jgi:hypothetical protein